MLQMGDAHFMNECTVCKTAIVFRVEVEGELNV